MKKAGLLVSEKERARQKANQAALQAMIASGQVKVSALPRAGEEAMAAVAAGPKKFSYGKKKPEVKKPITADKPSEEQKKAQEAAVAAVQAEASSSEESDSDSESESDSDSSSSDSDSTSSEESSSEEEEEVPDSWEDDVATPVAPKPAKVAAPVAAAVPDSWDDEVPDSWEEADSAPVAAVKPGAVSAAEIAAAAPKVEKPKEKTKEPKEKTKEPKEKSEHKEKKSEDKKAKEESKKDAPAPAVAAPVSAPSAVVAKPAESKTEVVASKDSKKKDSKRELRSPICCILGHVDTGKTKILDRIRHTNVQNMEAGGITQQIGATFVPVEAIQKQTELLMSQQKRELDFQLPGLLIIDTPGHESFSNLRSRGSGLCDIAVLVIDLMHGLEPQTIESINLLKMRKTPFIVALNKVDRCFGWNPNPDSPFQSSFAKQPQSAQAEFEQRTRDVKLQLNEQGLNCELYFRNQDFRKYVSLVPTSAITGEGIPDLLMLITQLTQTMMGERLGYQNELQCTILEVKMTDGIGYTIDVILVNGVLKVGDTIVLCGMQGPIVTKIRTLMTPQPLREMRVKNEYTTHTEVRAAMGVKISAHELEHAVSGSQLIVCNNPSNLEMYKDEVMADLASIVSKVSKTERGLYVQASTLGSLEALLSFLQGHKIPVAAVGIGPIHKKDVMKAGVMLERAPEYATILAFDVKITPDARDLAETMGVRIFTAEIIYHLFDQFTKYMEEVKTQKRADAGNDAVFPCVLEILPNCVFNMRDPLIVGVLVKDGVVKVGTPLCVPTKKFIDLGRVVSIEDNHVPMQVAKKGAKVCIRVELDNKFDSQPNFNRHYDITDNLVSKMSRRSIDLLKANYKDDLNQQEWMLVVKLKKVFEIM
jgi:translation initiation factor 5B